MFLKKLLLPTSLVVAYFFLARLIKRPSGALLRDTRNAQENTTTKDAHEQPEQKEPEPESLISDEDILKYVLLAEECEPHLTSSLQRQYFAKLEAEYKQIKRALDRCASTGSGDHVSYALRIIGAIYRFWFVTGRQHEGYNVAKVFLDSYVKTYECNRANAKFFEAIGFLAHAKGAFDEAEEHLTVALTYHTTLGNEFASATAANQLGNCARERGEYNRAESLHQTALEIFTKVHSPWGIALAQNNLGVVTREKGEWDKARRYFEESLATRKTIGDKIGVASSYGNLGAVAYAQEDYTKAYEFHAKCLKIRRKINDVWGVTGAQCNLGIVAVEQNKFIESRDLLTSALSSFAKLGDQLGMCEALEAFGSLEAKEQKWQRAAVLFGAAKELRNSIRVNVPLSRKGHHDKHIQSISSHVPASQLTVLYDKGAKMNFSQATDYAIDSKSL